MNQKAKLNQLILRILKEEMDKSQSGVLDITIPSKFAHALADSRVSDDPSYVNHMKSNDGGKTYNLSIKSTTHSKFVEIPAIFRQQDGNFSSESLHKQ